MWSFGLHLLTLTVSLLVFGTSSVAQASPKEEPASGQKEPPEVSRPAGTARVHERSKRPLAIAGAVSVGGPIGQVGAQVDYAPVPWLAFNVGAGRSLAYGLSLGAMGRVQVPIGRNVALGLESGISTGDYNYDEDNCLFDGCKNRDGAEWKWDWATWTHVGFSIAGTATKGFFWRAYFGYGKLLNPKQAECVDSSGCGPESASLQRDFDVAGADVVFADEDLLYFGGAFGYAFRM